MLITLAFLIGFAKTVCVCVFAFNGYTVQYSSIQSVSKDLAWCDLLFLLCYSRREYNVQ